jgi:hypothetical protein
MVDKMKEPGLSYATQRTDAVIFVFTTAKKLSPVFCRFEPGVRCPPVKGLRLRCTPGRPVIVGKLCYVLERGAYDFKIRVDIKKDSTIGKTAKMFFFCIQEMFEQ